MKWGVVLAALAVGLLVGYTAATLRLDKRAQRWLSSRDSLLATIEVRDAELALQDAEAVRLREQIGQRDTVRIPARRDTVRLVADSAQLAATVDTLLREQAVLHDRIGRDSIRLASYTRLVEIRESQLATVTGQRDSLRLLIQEAPVGQRGCRLLGLVPCPVVTVGYGATLADGLVRTGPVVAVGWRVNL